MVQPVSSHKISTLQLYRTTRSVLRLDEIIYFILWDFFTIYIPRMFSTGGRWVAYPVVSEAKSFLYRVS